MKALIAKIRRILRNRRTRLMLSRTVSIVAAFVVFVTTYALVLPAITMEKDARCGIEAHQHDDSCYELQLTCTQEEADGHVHTEDCYQVEQVLSCEIPEHQHSAENGCYDEEGNLVCTETEHVHDSQCYQENRELICGLEQSGGHHHDESCYEKILICGKQVHTHGPECYEDDAGASDPGFTDGEGIVGPGTVGTESGGNESGQGDFGGDDQGGDVFDGQEYDFGTGDQGGSQFDQDPGNADFGGDDFGGNEFEGRDDFSGGMEFIDAEPGGDSFVGGENWDADFTEETVFTDSEPPQQLYEEPYEEPYGESYVEEPAQEPYEEPYQEPYVEPVAEEAPVENGALTGQDDQNVQESGEGPAPEGNPAEGDEAEAGQAGDQTVENAESAGTETDAAAADQDAESKDAMGQDTADPETADLDENQQALDNEIDKDAEKEAGEKTEAADPEDDKAGDRESAENTDNNTDNKEETDNKEADKKEAGQDRKDDQDTSGTADSAKSNTGAAPADKTDTKPESTGYAAETTAADAYVPALDALDFNAILDKNTGIYYHAVEEGGVIEDSSVLYDWEKVKKDTELAPNDLLRIYLSYTIPAGSLNATNDIVRYRLPGNIHLRDAQKAAINGFENGISGQYMNYEALEITDPGRHTAYIGAEAVEGRRRPGQTVEDYLAGLDKNEDGTDPQELISAVVRTEDVCDAEGSYIGTDLVFTFSTYTVDRNQHEYDKDGNQTKAGEKVCGWFCFDLNTSQIDWATVNVEESLYAVEAEGNDIDNNNAEENGIVGNGAEETGADGNGTVDGGAAENDAAAAGRAEAPRAEETLPEREEAAADQASAQKAAAEAAGADDDPHTTEARDENTAENADHTGSADAVQGAAEDNSEASEASSVDAEKAENSENVTAAETAETVANTENAEAAETAEALADEQAADPQAADPSAQTNTPAAPEIVHATYQIVTTKEAEIIFAAAVIDEETGSEKEPISTKLVLKVTEFETRDELREPSADDPAIAAGEAEPDRTAVTDDDGQPGEGAGSEDTQAAEVVENADHKEDAEIETTDTDKENAEKDEVAEADKQDNVNYPAATFEDTITVHMGTLSTDTDSAAGLDIPERTELTVHVKADEGTFPEGTTMVLTAVTGNGLDDVAQAVEGAVEGKTKGFYAVDITFKNADGKVIEPRKPVKVTMKGEPIRKATENASTEPVVVHLENTARMTDPAVMTDASDASGSDETNMTEGGQAENVSQGSEKTEGVTPDETAQEKDSAGAVKAGSSTENAGSAGVAEAVDYVAEAGDALDTDIAAGTENELALERTETNENADAAVGAGEENTSNQDAEAAHPADAEQPMEAVEGNTAESVNTTESAAEKPAAAPTATVVETYRQNDIGKETDDKTADDTIMFEGDSFSIYAIVYTVDFHYEVNGKTYEFSIPGGGFVSLAHIIEALGINGIGGYKPGAYKADEKEAAENKTVENEAVSGKENAESSGEIAETGEETAEKTASSGQEIDNADSVKADHYEESINLNQLPVSEKTIQFVADIESVEFSSPDLIWIGKVDSAANVGQLKENNHLEIQYSMELTQDQISKINAQNVEAGDWALISIQPFTTEESLTVTMQNGERFEVRVTDGQHVTNYLDIVPGREYIIYVVKDGNQYYALKNNGNHQYVGASENVLEGLGSEFIWNYGVDETACWWYSGYNYLNVDNSSGTRNVVGRQRDYLFMTADNKGGFDIYGYYDGSKHLSWDTSGFKITNQRDVSIRVYMKDKKQFDFTVAVNNDNYGSVSCAETITNENKTNKTDIVVTLNDECYFSGWRLGDDILEGYGPTIPAGSLRFPTDGLCLTALLGKNYTSQATQEINEWVDGLLGNPIITGKTAHVYDYDNRVYEVDINASSLRYTVNSGLTLEFVTDASRSMFFPAQITPANQNNGSYIYNGNINLGEWLSNHGTPGQTYFVVSDVGKTATMYAVYWGKQNKVDQWLYTDASYYQAPDGKTSTVFKVSDITNGQVGNKNYLLSGTIYTASPKESGKDWNRLDYLKSALLAATRALYRLDPSAQIGLITFANEVLDQPKDSGIYRISAGANNESTITNAINGIWTSGGTNQQAALNYYWKSDAARSDLTVFSTGSTRKQVAILITDGAPNQSSVNWTTIGNSASNLRSRNVDLYTLGLSLNDVGEVNKDGLNGIAGTPTGTDLSYAFQAEKGEEFAGEIEKMLLKILDKAVLVGQVTDTIDPAFYPVDINGNPIASSTTVTQTDGKRATYVENNDGSWTVTYNNAEIGWPAVDADNNPVLDAKGNVQTPGWKTAIYVKAKEDFMGGNKISTNTGMNDQVTATGYKQTTAPNGVRSFETPFVNLLSVPYVNVDELTLTENSTEWRVYLGTDVDPKKELLQLWDKIRVNQVVKDNGQADEVIMISGKNQMLYSDAKDNDAPSPGNGAIETLPLSHFLNSGVLEGLIRQLDSEETTGTATLTYRYFPYGHGVIGTFDIELTKAVNIDAAVDHAPNMHMTKESGENKEIYTLKVKYTPIDDDALEDYGKTTTNGKSAGKVADGYNATTGNLILSENVHKIHVFAKNLEIQKKDMVDKKLIDTAKFKLYRTARKKINPDTGEETNEYEDETVEISIANVTKKVVQLGDELTTSGGKITVEDLSYAPDGTYYLVETQAPDGYNILTEPVTIRLHLKDEYRDYKEPKLVITDISDIPYNWTQTVQKLIYSNSKDGTGDDEKFIVEVLNNPGVELPATGGSGTGLLYLMGILLTALAGAGLVLMHSRSADG